MHLDVDIEESDSLQRYLRNRGVLGAGEPFSARVLAGGVSNRVVLVARQTGPSWVLKQALDKLRVPVDWFCSPRRIEREAAGMAWLSRLAPEHIARLVFCDPVEHILAMEAVPEPHQNWKTLLLSGSVDTDLFAQFGRLLAQIHEGGLRYSVELAREFEDRSYFQALRLEPYYAYTAAQVPESEPFLSKLVTDTLARRITLVHGDYSPKNILVHEGNLVLLDHEVIHWGDPAFDVGFSMAHFISKARHLRDRRFLDAARHYWRSYKAGYDAGEAACVRHTVACLLARVAGRSQLEYLNDEEKRTQRSAALAMIKMNELGFEEMLERSTQSA